MWQKLKGHRVLAADGTQIRLPDSEELYNEFGKIENFNQNKTYKGFYSSSLCTVLYDALNNIALAGKLGTFKDSEREHLTEYINSHCESDDLIILDRGYPSFPIIELFSRRNINFLIRCSKSQFSDIDKFAEDKERTDAVINIEAKKCNDKSLRGRIFKVRCIKVLLQTGETEILITSLLDTKKYKTCDFKRLKIETYFEIIKNRLYLENFTGKSVDSVKQDFYSTLLLTNIESDLTSELNQELLDPDTEKQYQYKINKQVSFNAIKQRAFELFIEKQSDIDGLIFELQSLYGIIEPSPEVILSLKLLSLINKGIIVGSLLGGALDLIGSGVVQAGIPRFLRSLLTSLESVMKETTRIVALHFGQISGSTSNTRLIRDAQVLEAFLID